jgi:hypothetical protein
LRGSSFLDQLCKSTQLSQSLYHCLQPHSGVNHPPAGTAATTKTHRNPRGSFAHVSASGSYDHHLRVACHHGRVGLCVLRQSRKIARPTPPGRDQSKQIKPAPNPIARETIFNMGSKLPAHNMATTTQPMPSSFEDDEYVFPVSESNCPSLIEPARVPLLLRLMTVF